jgi:hypothetical protein
MWYHQLSVQNSEVKVPGVVEHTQQRDDIEVMLGDEIV